MANKEHIDEIALDVLGSSSLACIADKYGISVRTLFRLRQTEEFKKALAEHKKQSFESALGKASYLSNLAIEELKNIITDKDSNAQSKIQACKVVLELAKNNYEYENIEQRICELEKTVKV